MELKYELNETNDGLVVTGGENIEGDLVIPSEQEYEGKVYPVTEIGDNAFDFCENLKSIIISPTVTEIGAGAFTGCKNMSRILISDSVSAIGYGLFGLCNSLTCIEVSEGNKVFDSRENCNAIILTDTNTLTHGCAATVIPNTVIEIGAYAFEWCESLKGIIIPPSVTIIGDNAFCLCSNLESVVLPDSIKVIEDDAFFSCLCLQKINTPESLIEYGEDVFRGCPSESLKDYMFNFKAKWNKQNRELREGNMTKFYFRLNKTEDGLVVCDFEDGGSPLTERDVVIPSEWEIRGRTYPVTEIEEEAFSSYDKIVSIVIPDSVNKSGEGAFSDCDNLKTIVISNPLLLKDANVPEGVKIEKS